MPTMAKHCGLADLLTLVSKSLRVGKQPQSLPAVEFTSCVRASGLQRDTGRAETECGCMKLQVTARPSGNVGSRMSDEL